MSWDDEDDLLPSYSKQEAFTHADKGKKEELKKRIKEQLGTEKSAEVQRTEVRSHTDLAHLKSNLAGQEDEETKREEREQQQSASHAPKTKTQKETEDSLLETAQDHPNADTLIERQEQRVDVSDEETASEDG